MWKENELKSFSNHIKFKLIAVFMFLEQLKYRVTQSITKHYKALQGFHDFNNISIPMEQTASVSVFRKLLSFYRIFWGYNLGRQLSISIHISIKSLYSHTVKAIFVKIGVNIEPFILRFNLIWMDFLLK